MKKIATAPTIAKAEVPDLGSMLEALAREGAQRILQVALRLEAAEYVEAHAGERDDGGHALVVRNGVARTRRVTIGSGTIEITAPRVDDRRTVGGEKQRFRSGILPPYLRRSKEVSELVPLLYLRGLSTSDVRPALEGLLGKAASGLSATTVTRLSAAWQDEAAAWNRRSLADVDYVYVWADGVYFPVRLEEDRLAALVVVGVRPDGTKELVAVHDGHRESEETWLDLLRDLRSRGMTAPAVAVGDGALGFWKALRQVWPTTREQRCWVHKIANVLDKLPKRLQPEAKADLHEAMYAPTRSTCVELLERLATRFDDEQPRAAAACRDDLDRLLTFFDFPAEHGKHLRTTNPIESTFATVKLRTKTTRGSGSRSAGLAMAFKLLRLAERTWRRLDAPHLVALVRAGAKFRDGKLVERDPQPKPKKPRKDAA